MYKNKKIEKKYIILISICIFAVLLGFVANIVTSNRKLTPVEQSIKDSVLVINKGLYAPVKFVKEKIKENNEKKELYKKYKKMETKVKETDLINAERLELKKELAAMKKALKLNQTLSEGSYLNTTVINRNLGYWYNTITIDKGSNNGVKENMAVVVSEGLVGKVIRTTKFNSTVKLLTSDDINNKISVKIKVGEEYVYGLLSGYDSKTKQFTIEGISSNKEIPKDSLVTTTGMGDIFPSGIVVGKVTSVKTDNFDLAKTVKIEGLADYDDLTYVTVLKRKDAIKQ